MKNCNGCYIHEIHKHCTIRSFCYITADPVKCPCSNCLIKIMCHERCEKKRQYYQKVRKRAGAYIKSLGGRESVYFKSV